MDAEELFADALAKLSALDAEDALAELDAEELDFVAEDALAEADAEGLAEADALEDALGLLLGAFGEATRGQAEQARQAQRQYSNRLLHDRFLFPSCVATSSRRCV